MEGRAVHVCSEALKRAGEHEERAGTAPRSACVLHRVLCRLRPASRTASPSTALLFACAALPCVLYYSSGQNLAGIATLRHAAMLAAASH
jgi:hypothetical protein